MIDQVTEFVRLTLRGSSRRGPHNNIGTSASALAYNIVLVSLYHVALHNSTCITAGSLYYLLVMPGAAVAGRC